VESDLIERAAQGDGDAYDALVRQHQDAVFRLAYLITGDPDDADDVSQETFIRAHRHLNRFDRTRPFRPWLLRIARNLARNRQRAAGRYLAALQRAFLMAPRAAASAEAEHAQRWEVQALWDAIRELNPQDQEIIYLRYMLELSVEETADALDIAPGTVKSRLSRALGRLRGIAQEHFPLLVEGWQP
jgi:RNA polymerase sigma-70 factor (ECF subfamily)